MSKNLLFALGNETRLKMLTLLTTNPCTKYMFVKHLSLNRRGLRNHLTILTESGLVKCTVVNRVKRRLKGDETSSYELYQLNDGNTVVKPLRVLLANS